MPPRKKARGAASKAASANKEDDEPLRLLRSEAVQGEQRQELIALWEADHLCDVVIDCDGEEFRAHRIVLAAGSAYIRAQLLSGMRDSGAETARICITDVPSASFRAVLSHLYRGECHVKPSSLTGTLAAASRLEVASLLRAGADFLERELTPENAIATWSLAEGLARPIEFSALLAACHRKVSHNFETVAATAEFPSLRSEQLAAVLAADNPIDASELAIFQGVAAWAKGQAPRAEPRTLSELFALVILEKLSPEELVDVVEAEAVFTALPESPKLIAAAYKFLALPPSRRGAARGRLLPDAWIVWNALDKHEWVRLSDDLLEVCYNGSGAEDDNEGANAMVRSTTGWITGRHYFEFSLVPPLEVSGMGFPSIGVVAADVPLVGDGDELVIGGLHGRGWGYHVYRMGKVHAEPADVDTDMLGGEGAIEIDIFDGDGADRYGLLLDIEAETLELYVNGVLEPSRTHTGVRGVGPLYAACEAGTLSQQRLRFNFNARWPHDRHTASNLLS